jgi:hypothetical protein
MLVVVAPVPLFHQPAPSEQIPRGTHRGQGQVRMPRFEPVQQFLRPPARMLTARLAEELRYRVRDAVGTPVRRAAAVAQPSAPLLIKAGAPLVAGLPADGIPGAEVGHRVQVQPMIPDESFALLQG